MGQIISVSRRTDIPAFYSDWFYRRLKQGYVLTRNPMNPKQLRRVDLSPECVDGFVFWSKNPVPMLSGLHVLEKYSYYFQYTLNPYSPEIEPGLPSLKERLRTFAALSDALGPERVIWRYDPIFLSPSFSVSYHIRMFEQTAQLLEGKTNTCVISFVDPYLKKAKSFQKYQIRELTAGEMEETAAAFSAIAKSHGLRLQTCAEQIDLEKYGISHGRCVDAQLLSRIAGREIRAGRDSGQRKACGCAASVDIGAYNTCPHGCRYCYASGSDAAVSRCVQRYDPMSPVLCGTLSAEEVASFAQKRFDIFG